MQLVHGSDDIIEVFDDVHAPDFIKFIVVEWVWRQVEVVPYVHLVCESVHIDRAAQIVLATTQVEDTRYASRRGTRFKW